MARRDNNASWSALRRRNTILPSRIDCTNYLKQGVESDAKIEVAKTNDIPEVKRPFNHFFVFLYTISGSWGVTMVARVELITLNGTTNALEGGGERKVD